jgi:hypothetical protein
MAILSVDLAYSRWLDLGLVILDRVKDRARPSSATKKSASPDGENSRPALVNCEIFSWDGSDLIEEQQNAPIQPEILAGRLNHICIKRDIRIIMLDGPQAWKGCSNGCAHSRLSERLLNTAAKTGLPGMVKPATYRTFAEFCVDVYDSLCRRGWRRMATSGEPTSANDRILVRKLPFCRVEIARPQAAQVQAHGARQRSGRSLRRAQLPDPAQGEPPAQPRPASSYCRRPFRPRARSSRPLRRAHRGHAAAPRKRPVARGLHRAARPAAPGRNAALAALTR